MSLNACACCGCLTVSDDYDICPICFWQDDWNGVDGGGANAVSLAAARRNYTMFGASEERFLLLVREPKPEECATSPVLESIRFPEEMLWDYLNDGWADMSFKQRKLWELIKRLPEEWEVKGYGPCWVVALVGDKVIFYDHFEEGFSLSKWSRYGVVDLYQSGRYLEDVVQIVLNNILDQ